MQCQAILNETAMHILHTYGVMDLLPNGVQLFNFKIIQSTNVVVEFIGDLT